MEQEESDEPILNIIELLLSRDCTRLCFQIYCELDSTSLANCRLVCQDWKIFIDHHFYQLTGGRRCLQQKLTSNFLNPNYHPRVTEIAVSNPIFDIQADVDGIFVATENGVVTKHDFHSLNQIWSLNVGFPDECLQLSIDKERVYAVTSNVVGHVIIINRAEGNLMHTMSNLHMGPIFGVRIYENILATAGAGNGGSIKFHELDESTMNSNSLQFSLVYQDNRSEFAHLDNDQDKLISGATNGEVIAWNFKTREKLHTLNVKHNIMALKVKWPIVATCTVEVDRYPYNYSHSFEGIKLIDLENEVILREIPCGLASDVTIQGKVLITCNMYEYEDWDLEEDFSKEIVNLWHLDQLLDRSFNVNLFKDIEHGERIFSERQKALLETQKEKLKHNSKKVYNRKIPAGSEKEPETLQFTVIVGSDILVSEDNRLIQHRFWP